MYYSVSVLKFKVIVTLYVCLLVTCPTSKRLLSRCLGNCCVDSRARQMPLMDWGCGPLHYWYFLLLTCADILSCTGPSDAWREEYKRDIAQLDTNLRALINRPSIISTTTLQELGALANKKPKVGVPLPDTHALAWDSPIRSPASDSC